MQSVVTTIIVRDLPCNVAHSPDLSMGVEPTPHAQTQEDELHRLETTLPSTPASSVLHDDGQHRQAIQGRNSMHGCKAANQAASGASVLCLLLGNRFASDGHAHLMDTLTRCSPAAARTLQHSRFCSSLDSHGWLDDMPEGTRSKLGLVWGTRDSRGDVYAVRIERKPGPRTRFVTASEQAPISYKRRSLKG